MLNPLVVVRRSALGVPSRFATERRISGSLLDDEGQVASFNLKCRKAGQGSAQVQAMGVASDEKSAGLVSQKLAGLPE